VNVNAFGGITVTWKNFYLTHFDMKLLFVLNDSWGVQMYLEHTGILIAPHRRSVEIELTEEQIKKINKQKIGIDRGIDKYETIESISLLQNIE
jgi:hypothetical protein